MKDTRNTIFLFFYFETQDTQSYYSSDVPLFPLSQTEYDINQRHTSRKIIDFLFHPY